MRARRHLVRHLRRHLTRLAAVALLVLAVPVHAQDDGPLGRISLEEASNLEGLFDVWDPAERMNRRLYWFNSHADDYALLPAVRGYEWLLPGFMRAGIKNFFSNLGQLSVLANSILQLNPGKTGGTLGRLVVNTTIGIGGLLDPATHIGLRALDEDFGQTLGYWGVPAGPYFVIPILGPSSVRDAFGSAVDRVPFLLAEFPPLWGVPIETLDTRANTPFRYGEVGGAFEYEIVRYLAMERRKLLIAE